MRVDRRDQRLALCGLPLRIAVRPRRRPALMMSVSRRSRPRPAITWEGAQHASAARGRASVPVGLVGPHAADESQAAPASGSSMREARSAARSRARAESRERTWRSAQGNRPRGTVAGSAWAAGRPAQRPGRSRRHRPQQGAQLKMPRRRDWRERHRHVGGGDAVGVPERAGRDRLHGQQPSQSGVANSQITGTRRPSPSTRHTSARSHPASARISSSVRRIPNACGRTSSQPEGRRSRWSTASRLPVSRPF
jgi:hypothetical protein